MIVRFNNFSYTWAEILRGLKAESGLALYDTGFEQWLIDEWDIKLLHESQEYPLHITGVELSEATLTMLRLKFIKVSA